MHHEESELYAANLGDVLHASTNTMAVLNRTFLQEHTGISASVCDDYRHSKDVEDQPQDMRAESESSHVEKQKLENRDVSLCYYKAQKVKMQPPPPPVIYLSFTGQGRHVRSPSMEEKTMVGRCFLNLRPFFSRWLFSATYVSPCWTLPDIRDTSSP